MMQEAAAKMSGKPTYKGVGITCECGGQAEFKEYRKRFIKTLHGEIAIKRACYRCRECGRGYIPWDKEQGTAKRIWTPRIKELVSTPCATLSYKAALKLVEQTTGLVIEESSGEEIVFDLGNRLRALKEEAIAAAVDIGEDIETAVIYEGVKSEGKDVDTIKDPRYIAAQEKSEVFGRRYTPRQCKPDTSMPKNE